MHLGIVGDSLSFRFFLSLLLVAGPSNDKMMRILTQGSQQPLTSTQAIGICQNTTAALDNEFGARVSYVRNDMLASESWSRRLNSRPGICVAKSGPRKGESTCRPWWQFLNTLDVAVVNVGAHAPGTVLYDKVVNDSARILGAHFPPNRLFFRSTSPGHVNCKGISQPWTPINATHAVASNPVVDITSTSSASSKAIVPLFPSKLARPGKAFVLHPKIMPYQWKLIDCVSAAFALYSLAARSFFFRLSPEKTSFTTCIAYAFTGF
jgi:hypothetical protein